MDDPKSRALLFPYPLRDRGNRINIIGRIDVNEVTNCRRRRIDFDVIRLFACLTILLIHFNASVCGYDIAGNFIYPNQLVPIYYFRCVYLGEIGNNLFFMLSGASLCLSHAEVEMNGKNLWKFYKKRIKTLLPAFWIAWLAATAAQLLIGKTVSGAPARNLIFSLFGVDGYFLARGWITSWFYQVGEWYLGCALLCYLVWPFIQWIWRKIPTAIFLSGMVIVYMLTVYVGNGNSVCVPIRICQMIAGACFVKYVKSSRNWKLLSGSAVIAVACIAGQKYIHAITVSFAVCWMIFIVLVLAVECLPNIFENYAGCIVKMSAYTYPIFLVHHKIISLMASQFDLTTFTYRYTVVLFGAYIVVSMFCAYILKRLTDRIMSAFAR